jgi:hypothetical protein
VQCTLVRTFEEVNHCQSFQMAEEDIFAELRGVFDQVDPSKWLSRLKGHTFRSVSVPLEGEEAAALLSHNRAVRGGRLSSADPPDILKQLGERLTLIIHSSFGKGAACFPKLSDR